MTEESIPMSDESQESSESPKSEWAKWRDLIHGAFQEGGDAGTNAGSGSASKLREVMEKGVYDATYGLAYGLAFGATVAKESIVNPARTGAHDGTKAGRNAAAEAKRAENDDDAGAEFCSA